MRESSKGKQCRKHTPHRVTQYKTGKASTVAQGKRRYDRKRVYTLRRQHTDREADDACRERLRWSDQARVPQEGACRRSGSALRIDAELVSRYRVQAKTTKKVVLRLECTACKYKMQVRDGKDCSRERRERDS